jgi:uncharacterized protein DUF4760
VEKGLLDLLTCVATVLSALAIIGTIAATIMVARMQKLLAQRQLIIPLWEYISTLDDLEPADPAPKKVQRTVNTLELVALCCEGGMVDENVIKRTFREPFIHLYDVIDALPEMPSLRKSGKQMLRENPSAMAFYSKLKGELEARDKLSKVR